MTDCTTPWYVLRAETSRESRIAEQLSMREIEAFAPCREETRRWSRDRTYLVRRAFFPGYVFARIESGRRPDALQVPGVIDVLKFGRSSPAATVDDDTIENVRRMSKSGFAEPIDEVFVGRTVAVRRGPFAGVSGILAEIKNKLRVIVTIEILRRGVGVEVDRCWIST